VNGWIVHLYVFTPHLSDILADLETLGIGPLPFAASSAVLFPSVAAVEANCDGFAA